MNQERLKKLFMLVLVIPLVWVIAACSNGNDKSAVSEGEAAETAAETAENESELIQFTDSLGREITLEGPAETIVTEQPSHAEIIYALGQEEKIIGRGSYVDYPEEALEIQHVGSGQDINFEEIIQLQPDVLLIGLMGDADKEFSQLEDAGITVIAVHAQTLDEVYENIGLIGTIIGTEEAADTLAEDMQATFAEYATLADEHAAAGEEPSVYFEISPLEYGLWTAGTDTFMHEIAEMLNMGNAFDDIQNFGEVSEEQVLVRNPDYIVTTTMESEGFDPVTEILNRPGWESTSAVENENVYMANSDEFTRPGPRLADAIASFYNFVYGEE